MANKYLKEQDVPSAKLATVYCTINGKRYNMMNAKDFEATASVTTKEVPILGKTIKGRKAAGMEIKLTMTVYKVFEVFDNVIENYKKTGVLPTFTIQVTQEDAATSIGRSTKVYKDCVIDGDVLLSAFDADGEFIEQEIEAYAQDYVSKEKYKAPKYM
ncbi:Phage tail tube protein [Acetitomaculum ruminis DSM 5522]|uniref:Phage tail tube protein n=1 Tax=Acetitomaculum ruminis DSM 5522 TaxID=1120918 RepID=A0A1I0WHP5_9FIRM|nr:phage tail tube protein [Acetitomaculum ruminis]SFA87513.1 Phage tail tube protein [Acetitomaculum ruminis DSM 5522]